MERTVSGASDKTHQKKMNAMPTSASTRQAVHFKSLGFNIKYSPGKEPTERDWKQSLVLIGPQDGPISV